MRSRLALAMAAVAALSTAALGGCELLKSNEQRWEETIAQDTPEGEAFRTFKAKFPADYERVKAEILAAAESNATEAQLAERGALAVQEFSVRNVEHTANGPAADLHRLAELNRDVIVSLQAANQEQCARFGLSGLRPGEQVDEKTQALINRAFRIQIEATAAGKANPVRRGEITSADAQKLAQQMRSAGVPERILELLGGAINTAPQADQCTAGVAIYRGMASLPPEDSAKWIATIMRDMARAQAATPPAAPPAGG